MIVIILVFSEYLIFFIYIFCLHMLYFLRISSFRSRTFFTSVCIFIRAVSSEQMPSSMHKMYSFRSSCTCAKILSGSLPSIYIFCSIKQFCSLRKHASSNILKISPPKSENVQIINSDMFHISAQNIDFGYSLAPCRGGSNENPRSIFE